MRNSNLVVLLLLAAQMGACAKYQDNSFHGEDAVAGGTLVGAGIGGVIGHQFGRGNGKTGMTALGAVAGGVIGMVLTAPKPGLATMTHHDLATVGAALDHSQKGMKTSWHDTRPFDARYTVITLSPRGGCRRFLVNALIKATFNSEEYSACKDPTGVWQIQ